MKPEPLRWWEVVLMLAVAACAAVLVLNVMPWWHR